MRKLVLLAAAVPLVFAPAALAADNKVEAPSTCRVPDVDLQYDVARFAVHVSLPASGCASREHRIFTLSTTVSRLDNQGGRDVADWSTDCGPFRSADDFDSADEAPQYSCDLNVALDHPEKEEGIQYDVQVTYPGTAAERTMSVFTFCTSDGADAWCEQ